MKRTGQSRVVGLLGVGFDHEDKLIRIKEEVKNYSHILCDYTPEKFIELVEDIY